jgi:hypothetical protein
MIALRQRLTRLLSSESSKKGEVTLCSQCQTLDIPFIFMHNRFSSLAHSGSDRPAKTWAAKRSQEIQQHAEVAQKNDRKKYQRQDLPTEGESEHAASETSSVTFVNNTQSELSVFPDTASEITITPSFEGELLPGPETATFRESDYRTVGTIHLNWLDDIARNETCPICRLIITYAEICHPHIMSNYYVYPIYRVGVSLDVLLFKLSTARTPPCHTWSSYLQPVFTTRAGELARHRRYFVGRTEHLVPWVSRYGVSEHSNASDENPPLEPLYRFTHGHTVDLTRLKNWLDICETSHMEASCRKERQIKEDKGRPLTSNQSHDRETEPVVFKHRRIINVSSRMVLETPTDCRYVALGHRQYFPLSVTRILSRWKTAFTRFTFAKLPDNLPAVFEDAITVTRELGETYLWIDALCVLETEEELSYTLNHRTSIYDDAALTLIAATDEPSWGLPGLRHGSRFPHSQVPAVVNGIEVYLSWPLLRDVLDGFGYEGEDATVWSWRYKMYKASLECRRCLVFGDYQVFWKCAVVELEEVDVRDRRRGDGKNIDLLWG